MWQIFHETFTFKFNLISKAGFSWTIFQEPETKASLIFKERQNRSQGKLLEFRTRKPVIYLFLGNQPWVLLYINWNFASKDSIQGYFLILLLMNIISATNENKKTKKKNANASYNKGLISFFKRHDRNKWTKMMVFFFQAQASSAYKVTKRFRWPLGNDYSDDFKTNYFAMNWILKKEKIKAVSFWSGYFSSSHRLDWRHSLPTPALPQA